MASGRLHLNGRCHHVLGRIGHVGEQVTQEVHPGALTAEALEHPLDRRRQPQVDNAD